MREPQELGPQAFARSQLERPWGARGTSMLGIEARSASGFIAREGWNPGLHSHVWIWSMCFLSPIARLSLIAPMKLNYFRLANMPATFHHSSHWAQKLAL